MKLSSAFALSNVNVSLNATKTRFHLGGEGNNDEGEDNDISGGEGELVLRNWHFSKLSAFQISRREEGGIMCITAERMKGKFGHSAL